MASVVGRARIQSSRTPSWTNKSVNKSRSQVSLKSTRSFHTCGSTNKTTTVRTRSTTKHNTLRNYDWSFLSVRSYAQKPDYKKFVKSPPKTTEPPKETAQKEEPAIQAEAPQETQRVVEQRPRKEIPPGERLLDDELNPTPKLEKIAAQVFKKLDADRDGVLNATEYANYLKAFARDEDLVRDLTENWSASLEELKKLNIEVTDVGLTQKGFLRVLADDISITPADTRAALRMFAIEIPDEYLPYPALPDGELEAAGTADAAALIEEIEDLTVTVHSVNALKDESIDFTDWTKSVAKLKPPGWIKGGKDGRFAHMLYDIARCDLNKEGLDSTMAGVKRLRQVFSEWTKEDPRGYFLIDHSAEKVLPLKGTKISDTPPEFAMELADAWMTKANCGPAIRFFMMNLVTDGTGGNLRRLPRILDYALEIYSSEAGLVEGVVVTATPMSQEELVSLQNVIETSMPKVKGKTLTSFINKVDPSILGGMKLYIGDVYMDASVAKRTAQLEKELQERVNMASQGARSEFEQVLRAYPGELTTFLGKQLGLI